MPSSLHKTTDSPKLLLKSQPRRDKGESRRTSKKQRRDSRSPSPARHTDKRRRDSRKRRNPARDSRSRRDRKVKGERGDSRRSRRRGSRRDRGDGGRSFERGGRREASNRRSRERGNRGRRDDTASSDSSKRAVDIKRQDTSMYSSSSSIPGTSGTTTEHANPIFPPMESAKSHSVLNPGAERSHPLAGMVGGGSGMNVNVLGIFVFGIQ